MAYRSYNSNSNAPSALLKAALLNTTNELGNDGPDFIFGWGKVNAYRAQKVLEETRYISGNISQGGSATHSITIPANDSLRIVISFIGYQPRSNRAICGAKTTIPYRR